jgi:hypothetical protein
MVEPEAILREPDGMRDGMTGKLWTRRHAASRGRVSQWDGVRLAVLRRLAGTVKRASCMSISPG